MDESTGTPPASLPMNRHLLGNGVIDDSAGTSPPFVLMQSPPVRHRAMDTPGNNPLVHRVIDIPTEPIPAVAVDRFSKRRIKKGDAFTLGLLFASLGFLYFSVNNPHSGDHLAIASKSIVLIVAGFLYLYSCFRDPGPKFLKVKLTVLVFCAGILVFAIFLTRHA